MPQEVVKVFQGLTAEHEAGETPESKFAHDADKLETSLQAIENQAEGHDTEAWRETSVTGLRTDAAKELARVISSADPYWWSVFAASYHELRARSRALADNHSGHNED